MITKEILDELSKEIDELLESETKESLTAWLLNKRKEQKDHKILKEFENKINESWGYIMGMDVDYIAAKESIDKMMI